MPASASSADPSQAAIEILNSRRRPKRPDNRASNLNGSLSSSLPDKSGRAQLRGSPSIAGMKEWLQTIGHDVDDISRLNLIHVAGTKGKGSTCAWIESFLRAFGGRTGSPSKTGLYTSPHLIYPEERIRLDAKPISRPLFARYFFEIWDALTEHDEKPRFLQLCALLAFHAFIREGVDAAIFETHHGGEYDATNVIARPIVTVITPLGLDHVKQLGPTIENIAWHKAGIFKRGSLAISTTQDTAAMNVLQHRATEKAVSLSIAGFEPSLPANAQPLEPDVQRQNCSVALAAARAFLGVTSPKDHDILSISDINEAIETFTWAGRFQIVVEEPLRWYLDGAHNEMSVSKAADWFAGVTTEQSCQHARRIIIFGQESTARNSLLVVEQLAKSISDLDLHCIIFTTYDPEQDFVSAPDCVLALDNIASIQDFSTAWKAIKPDERILFAPNIGGAMEIARQEGRDYLGIHVLVTGSQHLVGGALFQLERRMPVR